MWGGEISKGRIRDFLDQFSDSSPYTYNNYLKTLRVFVGDYLKVEWIKDFKFAHIEDSIQWVPKDSEILRFYKALRDDRERAIFLLYATSGLRKMEILKMRLENVDFETAKRMWKASETAVVYRIAGQDLRVLEAIPFDRFEAKTHAELAEELMMSTNTIRRVCQELSDRGLISSAKRDREGPERHAWEFWRTVQDSVMFAEIGKGGPYFSPPKPIDEKNIGKPVEIF